MILPSWLKSTGWDSSGLGGTGGLVAFLASSRDAICEPPQIGSVQSPKAVGL